MSFTKYGKLICIVDSECSKCHKISSVLQYEISWIWSIKLSVNIMKILPYTSSWNVKGMLKFHVHWKCAEMWQRFPNTWNAGFLPVYNVTLFFWYRRRIELILVDKPYHLPIITYCQIVWCILCAYVLGCWLPLGVSAIAVCPATKINIISCLKSVYMDHNMDSVMSDGEDVELYRQLSVSQGKADVYIHKLSSCFGRRYLL